MSLERLVGLYGGITLLVCLVFFVITMVILDAKQAERERCEKENASSASTPCDDTTKTTNTVTIAQQLVNLDHALMEMTSEILRVRAREKTTDGSDR